MDDIITVQQHSCPSFLQEFSLKAGQIRAISRATAKESPALFQLDQGL